MKLTLKIWRQETPEATGTFRTYEIDADPTMSWLELLDHLNSQQLKAGHEPVAFDSDCREGICGNCGLLINGRPHGDKPNTPACHQRVGERRDGEIITIEPFRARQFPVLRDLMVDRSALDAIMMSGAYSDTDTGIAPDADTIGNTHDVAESALDMAACIGCGACVAACPNGAANLFTGAKLSHLAQLTIPGRQRRARARAMTATMEKYFGPCSLYGECAEVCPAGIPLHAVAALVHERAFAPAEK